MGRDPLMPLHFLCTHSPHELQSMEFFPTPQRQTAHGYSPCCLTGAKRLLLTSTLVLPIFTLSPFPSIPPFQFLSLTVSSSRLSAMRARSSAYSSSHGHPVLNSMDRVSSSMMNNKGLKTEPWCTPTLTSNGSLSEEPTPTLALALWYIAWTVFTNISGTPSLRMAHQSTARGTLSKAFSTYFRIKCYLFLTFTFILP